MSKVDRMGRSVESRQKETSHKIRSRSSTPKSICGGYQGSTIEMERKISVRYDQGRIADVCRFEGPTASKEGVNKRCAGIKLAHVSH